MTARRLALLSLFAALLSLGVSVSRAEEEPLGAHTAHPPKTIVLDNERIQPSALDMTPQDALVFENHSVHPIKVTFTEPSDLAEKIRCGLVRKSEKEKSRAPWQLFTWNDGKLTATIPPGRFASVCSLQRGSYTFLASRQSVAIRSEGGGGDLPRKGQITVR
jgi:hypothetical protein